MSNLEFIDSLPYYDDDLQKYPYLRQKVDQELAKELGNPTGLHPAVPKGAEDLFSDNPVLKAELERVAANKPLPSLDSLRYTLPEPTSVPATDEEWQAALDNAYTQLQHQRLRQNNLALMQTYGANAWRIQNYLMEATAKQTEKALEEVKELTVQVNRERKNQQEQLGKQLTTLERRWTELISSILQIEMANVALDVEIERLNKRESELVSL